MINSTSSLDRRTKFKDVLSSDQSPTCSIASDIRIVLNNEQISDRVLHEKLNLIKEITTWEFFCGEIGEVIDNHGLHTWYIENHKKILEQSNNGNLDARAILEIVVGFMNEKVTNSSDSRKNIQLTADDLEPFVSEMPGDWFHHGYKFEMSGEESYFNAIAVKGYKQEDIDRILSEK